MTKRIWTGTCAAIMGLAAAVGNAQTSSAPQANPPNSDRKIVVTGCLKEAPASAATTTAPGIAGATGTAGTAGAAGTAGTAGATATTGTAGAAPDAAAPNFILTNASASSADSPAATSTQGAAPAASAPVSQTYRLIANATALTPHVGKKLELTGTLEDQPAATGTTESSAGSDRNTPALRVQSGKVVAASCSQ